MNHDHDRNGFLPPSLSTPSQQYFTHHSGMYGNQQLPLTQLAPPNLPTRHQQLMNHHYPQQYLPPLSTQGHMLPLSTSYATSTPRPALTIPYTPSSIASGSARSVSPASTAATSAQPLDFSALTSPSGEGEVGSGEYAVPASLSSLSLAVGSPHSPTVPKLSPTMRSPDSLAIGSSHAFPPAVRSSTGPARSAAGGHSASPIRRRANKQRLDDARRKEICTYARDRPKARQEDIALRYGVERSTISKILKNKDKWLSVDTHTRKSAPPRHSASACVRPSKFPEIETELLKWVKECQENGTGITDTRIKVKARECAAEIGLPEGKFKASSGWIENFKARNSLTRRSQEDREASPLDDAKDDPDQMDEDEDVLMPASQSTQIEDDDSYEADTTGQNSFSSYVSASTQAENGLMPQETSYSTFSTDSLASSSQDLSLFQSNTPMSSNASSFVSSPSGGMSHHALADAGMRSRGHSHSIAMRAVGSSCTPSGSPKSGASPVQPLSPARLDTRLASTPTSASLPRFPSPLSASTSASGNPLVMFHNARLSPVSQKHSRHPSDASGFSYDLPLQPSADVSNAFSQPLFPAPTPHQALDALDTVLKFFHRPHVGDIASQSDCSTLVAVRERLAERIVQSQQQLEIAAMNSRVDGQ
ncbi:hypothetical protein BDV93DRAFT_20635 [Ceratobasidium sp. AG-I]|nr:hypothetical protein BDV93DRAFT_20635 [Ceratobasidium sp. AG-I]